MPKLVFLNGECASRVCELDDGDITIGRNGSNMIVVSDPTVSRSHAVLMVYSPEVIVRDLGSTNSTLVHGRILNGSQFQVLSGQIIQFGLVAARLELEPPRPVRGVTTAVVEFREYMKALTQKPSLKAPVPIHPHDIPERAATQTSRLTWPEPSVSEATTHIIRKDSTRFDRRKRVVGLLWIAFGLLLWSAIFAFWRLRAARSNFLPTGDR